MIEQCKAMISTDESVIPQRCGGDAVEDGYCFYHHPSTQKWLAGESKSNINAVFDNCVALMVAESKASKNVEKKWVQLVEKLMSRMEKAEENIEKWIKETGTKGAKC